MLIGSPKTPIAGTSAGLQFNQTTPDISLLSVVATPQTAHKLDNVSPADNWIDSVIASKEISQIEIEPNDAVQIRSDRFSDITPSTSATEKSVNNQSHLELGKFYTKTFLTIKTFNFTLSFQLFSCFSNQ